MCEPAAIFSPLISSFSCTPWDCAVLSHSIGDAEAAGREEMTQSMQTEKHLHNNDREETDFTVRRRSKRLGRSSL